MRTILTIAVAGAALVPQALATDAQGSYEEVSSPDRVMELSNHVLFLWRTWYLTTPTPIRPDWVSTQRFYSQTLDHFNPQNSARWEHRYLFSDEHWNGSGTLVNGCKGPILFYTGNEGSITGFWSGNGFMIDKLAPKWGALLVFAEERYYGASLPFGNASLEAENLRCLFPGPCAVLLYPPHTRSLSLPHTRTHTQTH